MTALTNPRIDVGTAVHLCSRTNPRIDVGTAVHLCSRTNPRIDVGTAVHLCSRTNPRIDVGTAVHLCSRTNPRIDVGTAVHLCSRTNPRIDVGTAVHLCSRTNPRIDVGTAVHLCSRTNPRIDVGTAVHLCSRTNPRIDVGTAVHLCSRTNPRIDVGTAVHLCSRTNPRIDVGTAVHLCSRTNPRIDVGTAVHLCSRTNPRIDDSKCPGSCDFHLRSLGPHVVNVRIVNGDHLSAGQRTGYLAKKTSMGGENCKAGYQRNSHGTSASQMNIQQQRQIWPRGVFQSGTCDAGTQTYLTMAHLRPKSVPSSVPRIMCRSQRKTDDTWSSQHGSQVWQPSQSPPHSVPYGRGFKATVPSRVLREVGTHSDTCGLSYSCQLPSQEISKMGGVRSSITIH
ncbi:uncharacterized protein LOC134013551 [Osmerus eperlanus]|uniref:uncharacterized protein LOC134013551 n=1 Tax=Osmerus eperlanus TaxID=29151 RepID=UPI002E11A26E